jgi:outer membrane murein-binding lipoprotein Lpp
MINFRYHVVSIVAVFLALGIGIIMGTSVIDRAVVDRLESQQSTLNKNVDEVKAENNRLRAELKAERDTAGELADQGSQVLLNGTLPGVPVLVVGARGIDTNGLDSLVTLLGRAKADYRGTLWLTDRFTLDNQSEVSDLAEILGFRSDASVGTLRLAAVTRLALALRPAIGTPVPDQGDAVITALRNKGFLDYSAPEGVDAEVFPTLAAGTRIVVASGTGAVVPDAQLMLPFVRNLVATRPDRGPVPVLAVASMPPDATAADTFIGPIRKDRELADRMSTVDDLDEFSGQMAAVLALGDLGAGRFGQYGRGDGAQRLLPAPAA